MRKHNKLILIGIITVIAVGSIVYVSGLTRKRRVFMQRQEIADEGYETAQDILFPLKSQQLKRLKRRAV